MSIKPVFSVRDIAANAFGALFVTRHKMEALRDLSTAVNCGDDKVLIAKYPEQFSLYQVGTFDDESGVITAFNIPELVEQAIALKAPQSQE